MLETRGVRRGSKFRYFLYSGIPPVDGKFTTDVYTRRDIGSCCSNVVRPFVLRFALLTSSSVLNNLHIRFAVNVELGVVLTADRLGNLCNMVNVRVF